MDKMPPAALQQTQFPKYYMRGMLVGCFNRNKQAETISPVYPDRVNYCACLEGTVVQKFTMEEYLTAWHAHFDPDKVPAARAKFTSIETQCLQSNLK